MAKAGIEVTAGIDIDHQAEYAYRKNNPDSVFLDRDVSTLSSAEVKKMLRPGKYRLLAGCAPCQPFSKLTNGKSRHKAWDLLDHFGGLVAQVKPEFVTMENVPELAGRGKTVFNRFLRTLRDNRYHVNWKIVNCEEYGVPQTRKRLVLLASRLGKISIPDGNPHSKATVRDAISRLPRLKAGQTDTADPLHTAVALSPINLKRIKATPRNGGSWKDWPSALVLDCHKKDSGRKYSSIYGRMWWDRPAPTMTTLCTGIGNGRFGHPTQDRAISLREAALLQSFPSKYEFWPKDIEVNKRAIGRHIGNAVPPELARALGQALLKHAEQVSSR